MFGLTIIRKKSLKSLTENLSSAKDNLGKKIQHIRELNAELELLKVQNKEMYDQIHCKPHDHKGRFCKKEDAVNETDN